MTKILLTAVVADMRNSMAGTTFSKGRYGNYMKTKAIPVKRDTSYQNSWRSVQSYYAKRWRSLTESDRQTWVDGSINYPIQDKFGNTIYLSGYDLYLRLNLSSEITGVNLITDECPAPVTVPAMQFPSFSITWDAGFQEWTMLCEYTAEVDPQYAFVMMYCTMAGSAGKMVMGKTKYALGISPYDDEEAYAGGYYKLYFGNPPTGTKVFVEWVVITPATGQRSSSLTYAFVIPAYP